MSNATTKTANPSMNDGNPPISLATTTATMKTTTTKPTSEQDIRNYEDDKNRNYDSRKEDPATPTPTPTSTMTRRSVTFGKTDDIYEIPQIGMTPTSLIRQPGTKATIPASTSSTTSSSITTSSPTTMPIVSSESRLAAISTSRIQERPLTMERPRPHPRPREDSGRNATDGNSVSTSQPPLTTSTASATNTAGPSFIQKKRQSRFAQERMQSRS